MWLGRCGKVLLALNDIDGAASNPPGGPLDLSSALT